MGPPDMVDSVTNWKLRDDTLQALYVLTKQAPSAGKLHQYINNPEISVEDVQEAFNWLNRHGLVDALGSATYSDVRRGRISSKGESFAEKKVSVSVLADEEITGAIIHAQQIHNHAPSINNWGDHATVTQNNHGETELEKVISALKEANELEKADELQQEASQNGITSALKKAASWIATNAVAAPVIAQIAPPVFAALGV